MWLRDVGWLLSCLSLRLVSGGTLSWRLAPEKFRSVECLGSVTGHVASLQGCQGRGGQHTHCCSIVVVAPRAMLLLLLLL